MQNDVKFMKKSKHSLRRLAPMAALLLLTTLAGCGNLSRIDDAGGTANPVFPDAATASPQGGVWPNLDNLRAVRTGMSKTQMYLLLGVPHFHEGIVGVREWDYLFHLPVAGSEQACQFKVLFDKKGLTSEFHWKPEACAQARAG